jgi:hypothetical protein
MYFFVRLLQIHALDTELKAHIHIQYDEFIKSAKEVEDILDFSF